MNSKCEKHQLHRERERKRERESAASGQRRENVNTAWACLEVCVSERKREREGICVCACVRVSECASMCACGCVCQTEVCRQEKQSQFPGMTRQSVDSKISFFLLLYIYKKMVSCSGLGFVASLVLTKRGFRGSQFESQSWEILKKSISQAHQKLKDVALNKMHRKRFRKTIQHWNGSAKLFTIVAFPLKDPRAWLLFGHKVRLAKKIKTGRFLHLCIQLSC